MSEVGMNAGVKAKWTAALRSGQFEQGYGYLNRYGKLCCLGVLAEMAVAEGVCVKEQQVDGVIAYAGEVVVLPRSVMEWAGLLDDPDPVVRNSSLSTWNDVHDKSFTEIADLIEENL